MPAYTIIDNPLSPRLRSGHKLFQWPSPQRHISSNKCTVLGRAIFLFIGLLNVQHIEAAEASYTVLVYMVGSDLESKGRAASDDLKEMMAIGSTKNVNVVVQTGGAAKWFTKKVSNKLNQRWKIEKNRMTLVKNDLGDISMGKQKTLQDFLVWGVNAYPAKKYAVIMWDHGSGPQAFGYDENNGDNDPSLSMLEIKGALKAAAKASKKKFELVGFDACLMGSIEVATAVKDHASYMVASEELEPGHGWDYTSALRALNKKPTSTGAVFGRVIAEGYKQQATKQGTDKGITLAVLNLSKVAAVNDALDELIMNATDDIDIDPTAFPAVSMARSKSEDYGGNEAGQESSDLADLYEIAYNLEDAYPDAADSLMESIRRCVTYKVTSATKPNANGISIYFPCKGSKEGLKKTLEGYRSAGYTKSYQQFLDRYVDRILADTTPIQLTQADPNEGGGDSDSLFEIQVAKEDIGNIAQLYSVLAVEAPGDEGVNKTIFLGVDADVELDAATGIVKDNFTGYWTTLGGEFVSMFIESDEESFSTYIIPAKLNGELVDIRVLYDDEYPDGEILGAWKGYDEETGMPDKDLIELRPGDTITPRFYFYTVTDGVDGYVDGYIDGEAFVVGDELKLEQTKLPDGEYLYGFSLTDAAQNNSYSDYVTFSIEGDMIGVENEE